MGSLFLTLHAHLITINTHPSLRPSLSLPSSSPFPAGHSPSQNIHHLIPPQPTAYPTGAQGSGLLIQTRPAIPAPASLNLRFLFSPAGLSTVPVPAPLVDTVIQVLSHIIIKPADLTLHASHSLLRQHGYNRSRIPSIRPSYPTTASQHLRTSDLLIYLYTLVYPLSTVRLRRTLPIPFQPLLRPDFWLPFSVFSSPLRAVCDDFCYSRSSSHPIRRAGRAAPLGSRPRLTVAKEEDYDPPSVQVQVEDHQKGTPVNALWDSGHRVFAPLLPHSPTNFDDRKKLRTQ